MRKRLTKATIEQKLPATGTVEIRDTECAARAASSGTILTIAECANPARRQDDPRDMAKGCRYRDAP